MIEAVAEALTRSVMRRRRTGRAIARPVAVFVVPITSAIMIAGNADGGSAQRAEARVRREARARTGVAAARCARENGPRCHRPLRG